MEDNTPLLAASYAAPRLQRRKLVSRFVNKMLGEEFDAEANNRVNPEASGVGLPTDTAVVYYPGMDEGIIVYGPNNTVKEMMTQFFHQTLPSISSDMAQYASMAVRDVPVKDLTRKAVAEGMIVLFGNGDKLDQVMTRRYPVRLPGGTKTAEDVFTSAELKLYVFQGIGSIQSNPMPIKDVVPELKWLATA